MTDGTVKRAIVWVAVLNGAYFVVEFVVGITIRSVGLIADSIDFLEDASINILVLIGLGLAATVRARLGSLLAIIIGVPGVVAFAAAIEKIINPAVPSASGMTFTAIGALAVNIAAAIILSRVKNTSGSLVHAAWLSARNDVVANCAIIVAALATAVAPSAYWDVAVGIGIGILNADAALAVWRRSRAERDEAQP